MTIADQSGTTARPVDGEGKISLTLRVNGRDHFVRALRSTSRSV